MNIFTILITIILYHNITLYNNIIINNIKESINKNDYNDVKYYTNINNFINKLFFNEILINKIIIDIESHAYFNANDEIFQLIIKKYGIINNEVTTKSYPNLLYIIFKIPHKYDNNKIQWLINYGFNPNIIDEEYTNLLMLILSEYKGSNEEIPTIKLLLKYISPYEKNKYNANSFYYLYNNKIDLIHLY